MLSAVIPSEGRQPAVPLAGQLAHESFVHPGPLVLGIAPHKIPAPTLDRDRHCCYSVRSRLLRTWPGHFCPALHVAMQIGPYLHHIPRQEEPMFGIWSLRILTSSPSDALGDTGRLRSWKLPVAAALGNLLRSGALLASSHERWPRR